MLRDPGEKILDQNERIAAGPRVRGQEPVKDRGRVGTAGAGQMRDELRQADQNEQDERNGGEQRVERQRARQKGDVALVGGLQDAAQEAGRR